ncbi:hypothetical protein A4A49_26560 [Nicotiana attenuata]|uniref:Uncharacterized protein n=1 Tax=Nicotiana attenuata TaxID=49451 RepID=A0A1J6KX55_NICAT|nr:hypothetical protein A4A49_26560 [Nicotiana attenuata]
MNFNFPAGHENVQPQQLGYQVFNGEVAGEIAPLPGAHGEYAVAPGFVDLGFAGGVDLEMAFEQLVEVTEEAGPSGEMADFQDHTNIFGENGSSSSSNTTKE